MTQQLGHDVQHRPSVFAVRARRLGDGRPVWAYRAVCACGAQTNPQRPATWRLAMVAAHAHLMMASAVRGITDAEAVEHRAP